MIKEKIPDIQYLTETEKALLAQELWAEVFPQPNIFLDDAEFIQLLESRWEHYQVNPETATTWSRVKERLLDQGK